MAEGPARPAESGTPIPPTSKIPTPVSPWTAVLAVADKCREYRHEVSLDGENIEAARAAGEALLTALGIEIAGPEGEEEDLPEVTEEQDLAGTAWDRWPENWRDPDEEEVTEEQDLAALAAYEQATGETGSLPAMHAALVAGGITSPAAADLPRTVVIRQGAELPEGHSAGIVYTDTETVICLAPGLDASSLEAVAARAYLAGRTDAGDWRAVMTAARGPADAASQDDA
jgi:hypothetical protein